MTVNAALPVANASRTIPHPVKPTYNLSLSASTWPGCAVNILPAICMAIANAATAPITHEDTLAIGSTR